MPRWSSPPIQTKGVESNIHVMFAITTCQMRRFGVDKDEIVSFQERARNINSFEEGCDLIREWFPLDIDLLILNACPHNNCQYPGCPKTCDGRAKVKVRARNNDNEPRKNSTKINQITQRW